MVKKAHYIRKHLYTTYAKIQNMPTDKEYAGVEDIPEPFKIRRLKDITAFLIGPAIISVSFGMGAGEMVSGPLAVLSYGPTILWICLISILFQTVSAIAATRITIATGEPLMNAASRLWIGKKAWAILWCGSEFIRLMWPYILLSSGTVMAFVMLGRAPQAPDQYMVIGFAILTLVIAIAILSYGNKVLKTLGIFSGLDVLFEVGILAVITLAVVPADKLFETFAGFFAFGQLPKGVDWLIISGFAGYAGLYSANAAMMTNYYRDTGWGMTQKVGYVPAIIGGKKVKFAGKGYLPKVDPENVRRFNGWMKYVHFEQWILFFGASLITMWFPVALAYALVPRGASLPSGWAFPVALGNYMPIAVFGILMTILLLTLYVTNSVNITDQIPREFTNIFWTAFPSLERIFKGDVRKFYYSVLAVYASLQVILMFAGASPTWLTLFTGSLANIVGVIVYVALIGVNYTLPPKEYRMKWWEALIVFAGLIFYIILSATFILQTFFGIKI
jgi:Mn2+/Fe2+ NRAMP family transporter